MKLCLILATKESDNNNLIPLGIAYLSSVLNINLPQVKVAICETEQDLVKEQPDIVGISALSENYYVAVKWAKKIKKKLNIPIIIGGLHISLVPGSMKKCFDIAVIGEGEKTIVELMNSIIEQNGINYNRLKNISGLLFYHNGQLVITEKREYIKNLDELPFLNRELLPYNKEYAFNHIFSARGCPYKCAFCASTIFFPQYRSFSIDRIIKEIEHLINEHKTEHIIFFDDLLIASKKRLRKLVNKIKDKGIAKKCTFSCQVRANLINDEVCQLLQQMRVKDVGIGLESFSGKILKYYNKTGCTPRVNQRALDLLNEYGIQANPCIILGAPIETRDDMLKTLRALYKNIEEGKILDGGWGLLRPYPGTQIWKLAEEQGVVSNDMNWEKFSDWSNFELYLCQEMTKNELIELVEEWLTKYTLLKGDNSSNSGNLFINSPHKLFNNIYRYKEIIYHRVKKEKKYDLGDELILNYNEQVLTNLNEGWFEQQTDGSRWISKSAKASLFCKNKKFLHLSIYIADFYTKIGMFPIELEILVDQKLLKSIVFTTKGIHNLDIPLSNSINDIRTLDFRTNKSFIPAEENLNDDHRELSLIISKIFLT